MSREPITEAEINARLEAIVANRTLDHGRRIIKIEDSVYNRLRPRISGIVRELEARAASEIRNDWAQGRDQQLARWLQDLIKQKMPLEETTGRLVGELATLAQDEAAAHSAIVTFDGAVSGGTLVGLTSHQARALVRKPLDGCMLRTHLDRLGTRLFDKLHDQLIHGMTFGESMDEIAARLLGVKSGSWREALSLSRSWVQEVSNRARYASMEANQKIVRGAEWSATLCSRTCRQCGALHGRTWFWEAKGAANMEAIPPGLGGRRPPIHWQCRCSLIPLTDSWARRLGIKDREGLLRIERQYPKYRYKGNVRTLKRRKDYWDWLKRQPTAAQLDHLGRTRYEMIRAGQIDYDDLITTRGKLRLIEDLKRKAKAEQRKAA